MFLLVLILYSDIICCTSVQHRWGSSWMWLIQSTTACSDSAATVLWVMVNTEKVIAHILWHSDMDKTMVDLWMSDMAASKQKKRGALILGKIPLLLWLTVCQGFHPTEPHIRGRNKRQVVQTNTAEAWCSHGRESTGRQDKNFKIKQELSIGQDTNHGTALHFYSKLRKFHKNVLFLLDWIFLPFLLSADKGHFLLDWKKSHAGQHEDVHQNCRFTLKWPQWPPMGSGTDWSKPSIMLWIQPTGSNGHLFLLISTIKQEVVVSIFAGCGSNCPLG